MEAHKAAKKLGLEKATSGYECYVQNEIGNDELIKQLDALAPYFYYSNDEDFDGHDFYVFKDNSCINRQGDEYFINNCVMHLDSDYLANFNRAR